MSDDALRDLTRRHFFRQAGISLGSIALSTLLDRELRGQEASLNPMAPRRPHFAPRAKNIIYLFMMGAPSQLDLFDEKQKLRQYNDQPVPEEVIKGERFAFIKGVPKLLGSPYEFQRCGQSGATVSNLLPHLKTIVDDCAFVKSVHTNHFNHAPAQVFMNTGHTIVGRPSMGSWLTYGLGSESSELPGFVVLISGKIDPGAGSACWSSGFLPTTYQGVEFRSKGDPVLCVSNPDGVDRDIRGQTIETLRALNQKHLDQTGDPEIATRIAAYEMAYRMQSSVPELVDVTREPRWVHDMYGTEPGKNSFANNCLLARRLVERGVRFVQLYHRGWDHHGTSHADDIPHGLPDLCRQTDQAAVALVKDLKARGMLDDTLVIWGGEFGRTPMNESRGEGKFMGRDHHPRAFTMWMAGGGIKPGLTMGATDDLGYTIAEDPVHVHDLHATALHLMGIDHLRLTTKFQGREYRLTDVHGNVVKKLLA
ncbi:MAG: DUF1501 domain-containing protein [Planctomycetes bacterium]|nr:DUF1501 domain-containing protein [Planctomycetota bacterium]